MSSHRWKRAAALLPLVAMLVTALPLRSAVVQASPVPVITTAVAPSTGRAQTAIETAAEDAALVRPPVQRPIEDAQFYFVMPDRFNNGATSNDTGSLGAGTSDADVLRHGFRPSNKAYYHGGDFKGLIAKLDYIKGLGTRAIWMTPVFKNRPVQCGAAVSIADCSAGYHGYWITDFTQVDPHLGTNEELRTLIAEAHARGMKVFFDIITNHTADVIDYAEKQYDYRNKSTYPYRDANGNIFDDKDYAGTNTFPPLDPTRSFAYTPVFRTPEDAHIKKPGWLNNPIYYHNRGNSTFSGESAEYGDFFGLDDLFTEQPAVAQGMTDIYKTWIDKFSIDGFRIDTVKHVDMQFWQKFGPEILAYARSKGKSDFFMYGEVFSGDIPFVSTYSTEGRLPAELDFPFQGTARGFASQSGKTDSLRDLFASDDYYTDADSNAYQLPTFLGNHDMGRFGLFLKQDNPGVTDSELLARDRLGHALMYFARGMPVVYYGDEQGFTGDGGDQDARQDMMPSQVASYNDDDLIGTDATTAQANFDTNHPLYQALKQLASIRQANKALRRGAQIHRYSTGEAGIYAFSRIARDEKVEYIVALNNAKEARSATFKTFLANAGFTAVYPVGGAALTTNANAEITVNVPALGFVIYKADRALPMSPAAPDITMQAPKANEQVSGRIEVGANLSTEQLAEVTFAVKVGQATKYTVIGTDTNAPYRVFYDTKGLKPGTTLTFKAIVNDLDHHLKSATVDAVVGQPGGCQSNPTYAIIHYKRPAGDYDGWGLHLWGDAIDPSEATQWTSPKLFNGQDSYGVFWFIKLQDASQPLNFIVHKGDTKDTPNDRSFVPAQSPEVWLVQDDPTIYTTRAQAQGYVTLHYKRPAGDYTGWGLHLWGDAIDPSEATTWDNPKPPTGFDDYGAFFNVRIQSVAAPVNFIVHKGDTKDTPDDRKFDPAASAEVWLAQDDPKAYTTRAGAEDDAIIHYHRFDGDYGDPSSSNFNDYWGLHVWTGANPPNPSWQEPYKPAGRDAFGIYFKIPLVDNATLLNYIIHRGDNKDLPDDQALDITKFGNEVWVLQSTPGYLLPLVAGCVQKGDLNKAAAHWVARDTVAWKIEGGQNNIYKLFYTPDGGLALSPNGIVGGDYIILTADPNGLSPEIKARFPELADYAALKIRPQDQGKVRSILKGQFAIAAFDGASNLLDATSVQIPGVLDDLYTYNGQLGVIFNTSGGGAAPTLKLWAPTARSVKLHVYNNSTTTADTVYAMTGDPNTGVWSIKGTRAWANTYYLYEVEVYVPLYSPSPDGVRGTVVHNLVTDPYSISLSMNSTRSQIVNLADPSLKPPQWDSFKKPDLAAPEDIVLYELHVRDFSRNDQAVPANERGTFKAFTEQNSNGMRHLRALAKAGLTHIHLLPAFDCATINEDTSQWQELNFNQLSQAAPDSTTQREASIAAADSDGFNWCYDPFHYTTPEGSYSTDPDGPARIREFREMVESLNKIGLRVVMDVVYNHTTAAGEDPKSVLDKVVPGYYQRLNPQTGTVETSTCCQNTATEHTMMEKLMVDSVRTWATAYKVDGFRFDLMGHHMKRNMEKVRDVLHSLTLGRDGVDGSQIYIYGEGWNFGEVANNARGVNATQINMAGTGIGTFNDRLRDAVRGGGPFDGPRDIIKNQGFSNGLYYDPNPSNPYNPGLPPAADQKARLLLYEDQIRVGMAGNLKDYTFIDRNGNTVKGSDVDYNGQPAGYTDDPQEVINYIEAHDNQTLFDQIALKAPVASSKEARVRMQNIANDVVMLGQGVPFFHAGQDMLRSKSGDPNSYNSGDWFNRLDFTYNDNGWGSGIPPTIGEGDFDLYRAYLANSNIKPGRQQILDAATHFQEMLEVRKSSKLFRLETKQDIQDRVKFLNTGPNQLAGLIVMAIADKADADLDSRYDYIVVLINANDEPQTFAESSLIGKSLDLHPVLKNSVDPVVRTSSFNSATGTFTIPARTTAVFVMREHGRSDRSSQ